MSNICVNSEINKLKTVIIHTPGRELELMTPDTAEEVLYDDILNLENAREQHAQLKGILQKVAQPLEVGDLLIEILKNNKVHDDLVKTICLRLNSPEQIDKLINLEPELLAKQLVTGTLILRDTLERFLSTNMYAIPPLPNLFFTRDAAMVINRHALISRMATGIRMDESIIMRYIFRHHPELNCSDEFMLDSADLNIEGITFEGGDILILREDTLAIGMSQRTSTKGIDYLIEHFKREKSVKNIFVVLLPTHRAWIHLDMVFTMIDNDKAVIFPDLINQRNAVDVIHIDIAQADKPKFKRYDYLLEALATVGIKLEPIYCGGHDPLYQKREQWQSGANFLTFAPGKLIGYGMNYNTFEELEKAGIPRIEATDVLSGKVDLSQLDKCAVAMKGSELTRGGGGCRCMTMPILRE